MDVKIFPTARERLVEIWEYTEKRWDEEQADRYIRELVNTINDLPKYRRKWKGVEDETLRGVFCFRHRYHYIFFREFPSKKIGVISILHENMDIPSRLKEDSDAE